VRTVQGSYHINDDVGSHATSRSHCRQPQQQQQQQHLDYDSSSSWQRDVSETPSSVDRPVHFSLQLPIDLVDH